MGVICGDSFFDLAIILCILINTSFMAWEQANMSEATTEALKNANYVRVTNRIQLTYTIKVKLLIAVICTYLYVQIIGYLHILYKRSVCGINGASLS